MTENQNVFPFDIIKFEDGWTKIYNNGIKPFFERANDFNEDIFKSKSIPQYEYSITYDTIFSLCTQRDPFNYSNKLYKKYTDCLIDFNNDSIIPYIKKQYNENITSSLLEAWNKTWKTYKWVVEGLRKMFMYLDRFYIPNNHELKTITEQGYITFKNTTFNIYRNDIKKSIISLISTERNGNKINKLLLKSAIEIFIELGKKVKSYDLNLYTQEIETPIFENIYKYYKGNVLEWVKCQDCSNYLKNIESHIEEETKRLKYYLHQSSWQNLSNIFREELLIKQSHVLFNRYSGLNIMFEKKNQDLSMVFRLYQPIKNGLVPIAKALYLYIYDKCQIVINEYDQLYKNNDERIKFSLITKLICLIEKFNKIVANEFHGNEIFIKYANKGFEESLNKRKGIPKLLVEYIHNLLIDDVNSQNIFSFENKIKNICILYRYLQDKNDFENSYQCCLMDRIFYTGGRIYMIEKYMADKLKSECGYQWTSKLEGMFNDIISSKKFCEKWKNDREPRINLDVIICSTGAWPIDQNNEVGKIPEELKYICEDFKNYYTENYRGRNFAWRLEFGRAELEISFLNIIKKINVSTIQMLILLLFRERDGLKYSYIKNKLNLPDEILKPHLLILTYKNYSILNIWNDDIYDPSANNYIFYFNHNYKNNSYYIKVPVVNKNNSKRVKIEKSNTNLNLTTYSIIDASIVKILKKKKMINHHALTTYVLNELKDTIKITISEVKKRIESLIDQEYIERDPDIWGNYCYKP